MVGENKNIYESCKHFYLINKLLGLAPFYVDKKTKSFKQSCFTVAIFSLSILFCVLSTWLLLKGYTTYFMKSGIRSALLDNLWKHQYTLQHFLCAFVPIHNLMKMKKIENILKLMTNFDDMITKLQWNFKARDKSLNAIVLIFWMVFIMMIVFSFAATFYEDDHYAAIADGQMFLRMMLYTILTMFFLLISLRFIVSAHNVRTRFIVLTNNLK